VPPGTAARFGRLVRTTIETIDGRSVRSRIRRTLVLNNAIRTWVDQALVPVGEADQVGRRAIGTAYLGDLRELVVRPDDLAVDVKSVTNGCLHGCDDAASGRFSAAESPCRPATLALALTEC
jgi:hypothetical protein